MGGFNNIAGRLEVGLADAEVDDVSSLSLRLVSVGEYVKCGLGA
jgi:hypothetical protein